MKAVLLALSMILFSKNVFSSDGIIQFVGKIINEPAKINLGNQVVDFGDLSEADFDNAYGNMTKPIKLDFSVNANGNVGYYPVDLTIEGTPNSAKWNYLSIDGDKNNEYGMAVVFVFHALLMKVNYPIIYSYNFDSPDSVVKDSFQIRLVKTAAHIKTGHFNAHATLNIEVP